MFSDIHYSHSISEDIFHFFSCLIKERYVLQWGRLPEWYTRNRWWLLQEGAALCSMSPWTKPSLLNLLKTTQREIALREGENNGKDNVCSRWEWQKELIYRKYSQGRDKKKTNKKDKNIPAYMRGMYCNVRQMTVICFFMCGWFLAIINLQPTISLWARVV